MSSRLFCVGLAGPALEPAEREILSALPPWGVILFRRNIEDAERLERLAGQLRELGIRHLLLDQEGGHVDRLRDLVAPAPSLRRAARTATARRAGTAAGAALARLGFDVDLAPVVDRGVEGAGALVLGERCAALDPAEIIRAAGDFLEGLHVGIAAGIVGGFYFGFTYAHWRETSRWTPLWTTSLSHALHNGVVWALLISLGPH